jgi:hypothetical protein
VSARRSVGFSAPALVFVRCRGESTSDATKGTRARLRARRVATFILALVPIAGVIVSRLVGRVTSGTTPPAELADDLRISAMPR